MKTTLALAALAAIIVTPVLAAETCSPEIGTLTEFKAGAAKNIARQPDNVGIIETTDPEAIKAFAAKVRSRAPNAPDNIDEATEVAVFYNKLTGVGMVDFFKGECSLGFLIMPVRNPSQPS